MNATTAQAQWEQAILRAYQTWAVAANLNIGLVSDGGEPLGGAGALQGDTRFGDIRIAAIPLSAPGTTGSTMADTNGFDYNDQTASGDLSFLATVCTSSESAAPPGSRATCIRSRFTRRDTPSVCRTRTPIRRP